MASLSSKDVKETIAKVLGVSIDKLEDHTVVGDLVTQDEAGEELLEKLSVALGKISSYTQKDEPLDFSIDDTVVSISMLIHGPMIAQNDQH